MSASTDLSGIFKGLGALRRRGLAAGRHALDEFAEHVLGDAQELCPVDTGTLESSDTAEPATETGGKLTKRIGFNTDYAAAVHERFARHDQGQWKYLETAMRRNAHKMAPRVAAAVKKALS